MLAAFLVDPTRVLLCFHEELLPESEAGNRLPRPEAHTHLICNGTCIQADCLVNQSAKVKRLLQVHFCMYNGIRLTNRTTRSTVDTVDNRITIIKPVTTHVLRHTSAVNCVKNGVSTASLSKILGHGRPAPGSAQLLGKSGPREAASNGRTSPEAVRTEDSRW